MLPSHQTSAIFNKSLGDEGISSLSSPPSSYLNSSPSPTPSSSLHITSPPTNYQSYTFEAQLSSHQLAKLASGGSENSQFVTVSKDLGIVNIGDIILEVERECVAGYTSSDVQTLLDYCAHVRGCVNLKLIRKGGLSTDLRQYLGTRFSKNSTDHFLQNTIRDNLYIRTVPCTTRKARAGEVNGIDYHFLTLEEFTYLEQNGKLLESGFYEGNHYGTPLPDINIGGLSSSIKTQLYLPGATPSSEGKRRRNRSNVEAFLNASKSLSETMAPSTSGHLELTQGAHLTNSKNNNSNNNSGSNINLSNSTRTDEMPLNDGTNETYNNNNNNNNNNDNNNENINNDAIMNKQNMDDVNGNEEFGESTTIVDDDLGPLPPHWEKAYTEHGEPYFINLDTNTSQWDDPRLLSNEQFAHNSDAGEMSGNQLMNTSIMEQLPYGWERIDDPQYGTYYIDHINKKTQYESPLNNQHGDFASQQVLSGNAVLNTSGSTLSIPPSINDVPLSQTIPQFNKDLQFPPFPHNNSNNSSMVNKPIFSSNHQHGNFPHAPHHEANNINTTNYNFGESLSLNNPKDIYGQIGQTGLTPAQHHLHDQNALYSNPQFHRPMHPLQMHLHNSPPQGCGGGGGGGHSRSRSELVPQFHPQTPTQAHPMYASLRRTAAPLARNDSLYGHSKGSWNSSISQSPLYATIGPQRHGGTPGYKFKGFIDPNAPQGQVPPGVREDEYVAMQRNAMLSSNHNYANVYATEPQYRMSEGHRHRENGMVSVSKHDDDLDKINESQATENDSVFTSGGGARDQLDLSIRSDILTSVDGVREDNNNIPLKGSPTVGGGKDAKNLNNENRDSSLLSLMPCLASCVQDKTYGTIEEIKKAPPPGDQEKIAPILEKRAEIDALNGVLSENEKNELKANLIKARGEGVTNGKTEDGIGVALTNNTKGKDQNDNYSTLERHKENSNNEKMVNGDSCLTKAQTETDANQKMQMGGGGGTEKGGVTQVDGESANNHEEARNVTGQAPRKVPPPTLPKPMVAQLQYQLPYIFTKNPAELVGEIIHVSLVKSQRGFGFTIIGGNDHQAEEFLQIKSITPHGPAWSDGKLQTGDVLVHVNGICVLGYTHSDVVSLFQSISPGQMVHLQICRGYKLPFDPDDPNMEIVTTQAVTASGPIESTENNDAIIHRSVVGASSEYQDIYGSVVSKLQSMHMKDNLNLQAGGLSSQQQSTLSSSNVEQHNSLHEENVLDFEPPKFLTVQIVKGTSGFGFTIADSANGQKVKKILDGARCEDLAEGDILVDINGRDVRSRLHSEVVQVLKECPVGSTARITVQRGGFATSRSKPSGLRTPVNGIEDGGSERGSHASTSFSQFNINPQPSAFQYRSKTPTADLYGSAKEVVVNRPKTPVVDTRNWECPEKPPRIQQIPGPSMGHQAGSGAEDSSVQNSIYGTTMRGAQINSMPNYQQPQQNQFEEDMYGHVRSKSEVWHYDYPTPVHPGGVKTLPLNRPAHSVGNMQAMPSSHGDYANYYALYSNDRITPQPSYEHDPRMQGGIYSPGYAESITPSVQGGYPASEATAVPNQGTYVQDFQVTLQRQESGFGFRIVGGTEEGSQVTIGHIVPGGAADLDGSILTGDEILSVDGHSVANASHHHVVQLMGGAALTGHVTLGLRRRTSNIHNTSGQSSEMVPGYSYNVVVERHESEGFGFVIISSVGKCGSTIGRIIEGSPAERCGKLQVGDRIQAVNGMSILDMHHEDIVSLIKVSGLSVTLTIAPRMNTSSTAINDDISSIGTNRPMAHEDFAADSSSQVMPGGVISNMPMEREPSPSGGPPEYRRVQLQRGVRGFGFSIRGGREFHNMPLFVLRIAELGPAQMSGQLQVGDQILEVNGICTDNMTHADAINLIRQGGNSVTLLIKRSNQHTSPLTVESPPSLVSQHSLGGPISQSSPRSPSAMLQAHPSAIYGTHPAHGGHWIG